MAYVPDPTNLSQPDDTVIAETATIEFRALKAYIASLLAAGSFNISGGVAFKDSFLINGQFDLWQRAITFSLTATGYTSDLWKEIISGAGRATIARAAGVDGNSPFCASITVTTPTGALGATDNYQLIQPIEGQRFARAGFGTAQARSVSLSFVAAFAVAGLHSIAIQNGAQNRSYVATFNVAPGQVGVASQYQIPNIPGDVSGTWPQDNTLGCILSFPFAAGANFNTATPNQWVAGNVLNTAGCVNEWVTNANNIKLTRVRFTDESGCSPYIARDPAYEKRDVGRYLKVYATDSLWAFSSYTNSGGTTIQQTYTIEPEMRVAPSVSLIGTTASNSTGINAQGVFPNAFSMFTTSAAAGQAYVRGSAVLSAEL